MFRWPEYANYNPMNISKTIISLAMYKSISDDNKYKTGRSSAIIQNMCIVT